MTETTAAAIVVALAYLSATSSLAQTPSKYQWKLESTNDGCQTYTSTVPNKEYIAAKTVCVIPAKMEVVGMVLRDIAGFANWMEDCKATKVLKVVDDRRDIFLFWFRQHIPLFSDRDIVLRTETAISPGHARIRAFSTKEAVYDADAGYVRMPSFVSEFALDWVDRLHTKVTFMIDPDLGEGLPKGVSNSLISKVPLKSLQGLARMAQRAKYIDVAKGSAYERAILEGISNGTLK